MPVFWSSEVNSSTGQILVATEMQVFHSKATMSALAAVGVFRAFNFFKQIKEHSKLPKISINKKISY